MELTKAEKEWIFDEIQSILRSCHDIRGTTPEEYQRRDNILEKGITEEVWNFHYDLEKEELDTMKSLWEKV